MSATALVDTNILVYRFDPRFPDKRQRATAALRRGLNDGILRVPHQAIVEFIAAATRPRGPDGPLLSFTDAVREAEDLMMQFPVLYPNGDVVRLALRGAAAYGLSWFDAHLWAYAEHFRAGGDVDRGLPARPDVRHRARRQSAPGLGALIGRREPPPSVPAMYTLLICSPRRPHRPEA